MKKIYKLVGVLLISAFTSPLFAQNVGIGTNSPDNSAVLDIQSSEKGLLIPRMTVDKRNAISNPANGLMIYQTNEAAGFYYYNGNKWSPLSDTEAKSIAADPNDWTYAGNSVPSGAFLGTTNTRPLIFKVNSQQAGYISTGNSLYLGYQAGNNLAGANNIGLGYQALLVNSGSSNTAIGFQALAANTSAANNVAIGTRALQANTTGRQNTAIGTDALKVNVGGEKNLAIGTGALSTATSGDNNISIGFQSLFNNNGSRNVAFGYQAGYNEIGSDKLYIANSNTTEPLVYGDFAAKFISIGDIPVAKRDAIATAGSYGLLVKGGIMTEKVKVALSSSADWADYVFAADYKLMPLSDVEKFVNENQHLPNVPSADQMAVNGLEVAETSKMFMEKIEELTLYLIELNKEVKSLKAENQALKTSIK